MSIFSRKKVSDVKVSTQDLDIANSLIRGMMQMVAEEYGVISVVIVGEKYHSLYVQSVKHLMFLQKGEDVFIVNNHDKSYLSFEDFLIYFSEHMQIIDETVDTMVTLKIFVEQPTNPKFEDGAFESYYWNINEFKHLACNIPESTYPLPPRISIIDGEVVEEGPSNDDLIFMHGFVSFPHNEFDSNGFLAEILSNAYYGLHAFSCVWKEEEVYFFKTSFFRKKEGSLRLIKHDNVMGLLNHNLLMVNMQARINTGKDLHVFVQSYKDAQVDKEASEIRGWKITNGLLRSLGAQETESFMRENSAGNDNQHITYV